MEENLFKESSIEALSYIQIYRNIQNVYNAQTHTRLNSF